MNIKKRLLTGTMAMCIGISSFIGVYANDTNNYKKDNDYIKHNDNISMKDYGLIFKKNVSAAKKQKAKEIFKNMMKYQNDSEKYWDELYKLDLFEEKYDDGFIGDQEKELEVINDMKNEDTAFLEQQPVIVDDLKSFDDFVKKSFRKDITKAQRDKAKKLYDQARKYEKAKKMKEAEKAWQDFFDMDIFKSSEFDNKVVSGAELEVVNDVLSFDNFVKDLFRSDITKEQKNQAKKLFDQAEKLTKQKKYDEAQKVWDKFYDMKIFKSEGSDDNKYEDAVSDIVIEDDIKSFDDFVKNVFKDNLSKSQVDKAKKLYEKACKLEKENKYEEAAKAWDELFSMDIFKGEVVDFGEGDNSMIDNNTFESFSKGFKKGVKPETLKKAKDLYNKAIKADKQTDKMWDELMSLNVFTQLDK